MNEPGITIVAREPNDELLRQLAEADPAQLRAAIYELMMLERGDQELEGYEIADLIRKHVPIPDWPPPRP